MIVQVEYKQEVKRSWNSSYTLVCIGPFTNIAFNCNCAIYFDFKKTMHPWDARVMVFVSAGTKKMRSFLQKGRLVPSEKNRV